MNTAMAAVNRQTQLVAGVSAVLATLVSFGGQLSLADHYAQSGLAAYAADDAVRRQMRMAARATCPNPDQSGPRQTSPRKAAPNARSSRTA